MLSLLYSPSLTSIHDNGHEFEQTQENSEGQGSLVCFSPWNSPAQKTRVGSLSLLQEDLPNSVIKPRSPTLQVDSLPAEPQGRPSQIKYLFKTHGTVKSGESESESVSRSVVSDCLRPRGL